MRLKLNLCQKLQIVIAAALFAAGVGQFLYFYYKPLSSVVLSMDNLLKSNSHDQNIQLFFHSDLLDGQIYSDSMHTVLTIGNKTFYGSQFKPLLSNLPSNMVRALEKNKPDIKYRFKGSAAEINDYGRPVHMTFSSFYLSVKGSECAGLLDAFIDNVNKNNEFISAYLTQIHIDSSSNISAVFYVDDFLKLRGIVIVSAFSNASFALIMETNGFKGSTAAIVPPDTTNGVDISNYSESDINLLFMESFDPQAGGN